MSSSLEQLGRAWLRLLAEHKRLFLLEAKLAKASLLPLLFCVIFLLIIITGLWISILTMVGYIIYYYSHHIILSLIAVVLFGAMTCLLFVYLASFFYSQLLFKNTVQHVKKYRQKYLQTKKANK